MSQVNPSKYPFAMRLMHWLMAIIILTLIAVGSYMADLAPDAADKYELYPLHKSVGMLALLFLVVRITIRLKSTVPDPASWLQAWEQKLSHWVHRLLYVSMFTMVCSGFLMSSTFPKSNGIEIFGLFTLPDITAKSEYWSGIFHTIHGTTAWVLVCLLMLHLAGVFKHKVLDGKDKDVLKRML